MTAYMNLHRCHTTDYKSDKEWISKTGETDEQLVGCQAPAANHGVCCIITNIENSASFFDSITGMSASRQGLSFVALLNEIYESGEYTFIGSPETIDIKGLQPRMKFNAIHKLIAENYSRTITLSEAAEAVGMNKTAFCNAFRRMYGTSFIKYFTHYRMKVAARLLETTTMNIGDIAYRVGFNDVPHFNRLFSDYFHTTPTKYRRNIYKNS